MRVTKACQNCKCDFEGTSKAKYCHDCRAAVTAPKINLTGKTFDRLKVIKKSEKRLESNPHKTFWECLCKCGKTKTVEGYWLTSGKIMSCGCKRKEHQHLGRNVRESLDIDYTVDGVDVTKLATKQRINTATGHKGVYQYNHGRYSYSAAIGVKKKLIQLGKFVTLEEAIAAREDAEVKYYQPILVKHKEQRKTRINE